MNVDILVAEIGSTTTLVNAFGGMGTPDPILLGQGQAPTSVLEGDVRIGINGALESLKKSLGVTELTYKKMVATSSAAGGLRMTVHGLVYDMTVRAGREAALGAGANIKMTTAGKLTERDIKKIEATDPNLILLAGGTDYGEKETALHNAEMLAKLTIKAPVIYCGNITIHDDIREIFEESNIKLYITENVYPRLDELNIEPVRALIHTAFEEHITNAPGMEHVRDMVTGTIMPTPGAVMECARMMYEEMGDLLAVDVGGATTDVHSVTDGSEEIALLQLSPEPKSKRTVEGDLGVYVSAKPLVEMIGKEKLAQETGLDIDKVLENYKPIPDTDEQLKLTTSLAMHCSVLGVERHAGTLRYTYGASGRKTHAVGKDLTKVKYLVATGGALTRLSTRQTILDKLVNLNQSGVLLYPKPGMMEVLEDRQYIMASLGVMSVSEPEYTLALMKKNFE